MAIRTRWRPEHNGVEETRLSFEGGVYRRSLFDKHTSFASGLGSGLSVGETERARGWRVRKFIRGWSGAFGRRFERARRRAVDVVGRLSRHAVGPPLRRRSRAEGATRSEERRVGKE